MSSVYSMTLIVSNEFENIPPVQLVNRLREAEWNWQIYLRSDKPGLQLAEFFTTPESSAPDVCRIGNNFVKLWQLLTSAYHDMNMYDMWYVLLFYCKLYFSAACCLIYTHSLFITVFITIITNSTGFVLSCKLSNAWSLKRIFLKSE